CGGCGKACSTANGIAGCSNGGCTISCFGGFGDCDGVVTNGCEAALNTNTNCAACGGTCAPANSTGTCATGTCRIASCIAGYADCRNGISDGCETFVQNDPNNCGTCGNVCAGMNGSATCSSGACV